MVTTVDQEIASRVGELAFFDVLDPGSVDADGHIVFGFARNGAGVAADALALINDKGILGHIASLPSDRRGTYPLLPVYRKKQIFV